MKKLRIRDRRGWVFPIFSPFKKHYILGKPSGYVIDRVRVAPDKDGEISTGIEITPLNSKGKMSNLCIVVMPHDIPAFVKALKQEAIGLPRSPLYKVKKKHRTKKPRDKNENEKGNSGQVSH